MRPNLALTFAAAGLLSGCVAYHIPTVPPPSRTVSAQTRQLTLGIERNQRTISSQHPSLACTSFASQDELIATLRRRATFKEVDFVDRLSTPPDLVLKDAFLGTYHRDYDPLPLILTLGLYPEACKTPYLLEFKLAERNGGVVSTVATEQEEPSIIGWVALPMKLNSQWSGKKIDRTLVMDRFATDIEKAAYDRRSR